jgi:hypothetical protein
VAFGSSASGNYRPACILCGEIKGQPVIFSWTLLRGAVGGCSITTGLLPEQVLSDPQSAPVCEASFGRVSGHEIGHSEADTEVIDALAFRLRWRICDVRVLGFGRLGVADVWHDVFATVVLVVVVGSCVWRCSGRPLCPCPRTGNVCTSGFHLRPHVESSPCNYRRLFHPRIAGFRIRCLDLSRRQSSRLG